MKINLTERLKPYKAKPVPLIVKKGMHWQMNPKLAEPELGNNAEEILEYPDEDDEPEENLDSMGYKLDKTDDNDRAYDAMVDWELTHGGKQ